MQSVSMERVLTHGLLEKVYIILALCDWLILEAEYSTLLSKIYIDI